MKLALLVCGQPRTFEFCFPSLKRHILDVYNPDVFICSDNEFDRMVELFRPKMIDIRPQDKILECAMELREKYLPEIVPVNILSAGWKGYRCAQMMRTYETNMGIQYDGVLITRFDVAFASIEPIQTIEENVIYIPRIDALPPVHPNILNCFPESFENNLHWGGYSTHLCWMTPRVAEMAAGIYFEGPDYNRLATAVKIWGQNPEHVMKYFCEQNGIRPQYVDIDMMIIRGTPEKPLANDGQPVSKYPRFQ